MTVRDVEFRVTNPDELARASDAAIEFVANEIADATERDTPVRTGNLARSWRIERNREGQWRVATEVDYAPFVEFGHENAAPVGMFGAAIADARSRYGT